MSAATYMSGPSIQSQLGAGTPGTAGGFSLSGLMNGLGGGGGLGIGGQSSYLGMILGALSGIGQAVSTGVYDEAFSDMMRGLNTALFNAEHTVKGYAGDLNFPEVSINPLDLLFAFANPNANPALSAATFSALQQLGAPTQGVYAQGSPQARAINQAGAMGLTQAQFRNVVKKLEAGESGKMLDKVAGTMGYANAAELYADQQKYTEQAAAAQKAYDALQPLIQGGRNAALTQIAQIQKDFPVATGAGISDLEKRIIDQRSQVINEQYDRAKEDALTQANVMGLNPARTLGEIERQRGQDLYGLQQSDALARAIQLLSGEQAIGSGALASLGGSLSQAIAPALQAGNLYSQGVSTQGQLALQQALATNQLTSEAQFYNANQQTAEQLARTNLLMQALGLHLGGEQATLQGEYQKATSFARGIDKFTSMYGGGGGGGGLSFA